MRVTRRLFRSGDSEYLLNGARVRLKDITQLLLHAGLSPDSYTVIGQGSIDELILQRPDERRVVFENAADIRRHQLRLNDTRSKLAATEANIVRVQDVLAELTPHIRRLKTQADRAQRAETFRSELHALLLRFFRVRLARAFADRQRAEEDLVEATDAARRAEEATQAGEQALRAIDEQAATLTEHGSVLSPRAEGFREQIRGTERSLAVTRSRIAGFGEQLATLEADFARAGSLLGRLSLEEAQAAVAAGQRSDGDAIDAPDQLEARRERLSNAIAASEAEQQARATIQHELESADRAIRELEVRLARSTQQLQSLQANLAVDQARRSDREVRLTNLGQQITELEGGTVSLGAQLAEARARLSTATDARRQAAVELAAASEGLRAASQQADRLHGALAALGAADLSRDQTAVLPPDWEVVLRDLPVVGLAGELATRIRPIDLLLGAFLKRIVVLTSDTAAREAHRRLSTTLPAGAPAWAVLSMDGLLLAAEGDRPIEAVSDKGQSALADWARQVRQVEDDLRAAESGRAAVDEALQVARVRIDTADAEEHAARAAVSAAEARVAESRRAVSGAQAELQHLRSEHERAARGAAQRSDERAREAARAQAARDELTAARTGRDALADRLRLADQRVTALSQQVAEARTELASLEAVAGRREAERAAREALLARIQSEIAASISARETARERLDQLSGQQAELAQRETGLVRDLEVMHSELMPLDAQLETAEERRVQLLSERQAVEQNQAILRAAERAAHETRETRHVLAQRAADEVERLNAEVAETQELEGDVSGSANWAEQLRLQLGEESQPEDVFDLDAARRRIATLQRELRAVGGVAESVVDEFRELSERESFLARQSADLRAAMAELHSAAAELEAHMRERFAGVFETIQAAFQECFSNLFGGGEARLVLTEPDDLLRTGIEIVARPPGKKLQGLLSLSGGERALTVVSLLFALLKTNPTPFCVLDEVDAALDEANVQRFANLLADFARQIQFIVVTHNRATMDKADAMYGVSMDAQGVSHIFSVRPRRVAEESRQQPVAG